ncbi:MAG: putative Fe(2+)-trafficking protein [Gammaproteobacteria bacterium]|jgi:Fe-S cluster biosynthesis and repair protein YggX|nr:putative Fe(2+)-trafficking protein [Gammaproteobacteria bacterium]
MTRIIYCNKLQKELEGLASPPYPGELGLKIYNEISQLAWDQWLAHQTMLINEYRLSLIDPKSKTFLNDEMKKFLFGQGSEKPAGFVEQEK